MAIVTKVTIAGFAEKQLKKLPLKRARSGQRSVRLSKSYRGICVDCFIELEKKALFVPSNQYFKVYGFKNIIGASSLMPVLRLVQVVPGEQ